VLEGPEWRRLIDAIPADTVRDLRDRARIATLTYGFARIGAALKMRVKDLQSKGSGWLIRLHEKGGKQHMMPCHHALAEALHAYIVAASITADKKAFLFRTSRGHDGTVLSDQPMAQADAWRMVRKRALAAGIMAPIGNHSFRATGITAYLANGGTLEHAQSMAAHESPRTTKLYDRTKERLTQDEIERIVMGGQRRGSSGHVRCTLDGRRPSGGQRHVSDGPEPAADVRRISFRSVKIQAR
jgi:integrase